MLDEILYYISYFICFIYNNIYTFDYERDIDEEKYIDL